eukprot:6940575-Alexandrium_andersonii.AAC.1
MLDGSPRARWAPTCQGSPPSLFQKAWWRNLSTREVYGQYRRLLGVPGPLNVYLPRNWLLLLCH